MKRVIFQRHDGLFVPGEVAAFRYSVAARLVASGVASWHPDDVNPVETPEPAEPEPEAI